MDKYSDVWAAVTAYIWRTRRMPVVEQSERWKEAWEALKEEEVTR
jgi:hypothetical protein